jgi:hypothetical protein
MKKLYYLFCLVAISLSACEFNTTEPGPRGPQGLPGEDGLDGLDGEEAYVFEYQDIDFTSPEFQLYLELPSDFTMLETDKMLIYFLWDYLEDTDQDVWRLLPQTVYTDFGPLTYNYDFTTTEASVFLEGYFDSGFTLQDLNADYTDGWIARVVVIPAQYGNRTTGVDYNNYEEVISHFGINPEPVVVKKAE